MVVNNNENDVEWISISELAQRIGKTKQTAYNQCKQGLWQTKVFKRGSMRGLLVAYPKSQNVDGKD